MLYSDNQQSGVTLGLWLLRRPSRREALLTGTIHARVPRLLAWKQSGTVGTTTTSVSYVKSRDRGSATSPKGSRARLEMASMATDTAGPPYNSRSPQIVPFSIPGARQLGWP